MLTPLFLKSGVTKADFQSDGIRLVVIQLLNIEQYTGTNCAGASFRMAVFIPDTPGELELSNFLMILETNSTETCEKRNSFPAEKDSDDFKSAKG